MTTISDGEAGSSVRAKLNAALVATDLVNTGENPGIEKYFSTRDDFVTWLASNTPEDGDMFMADGLQYKAVTGSTKITDMAGIEPAGLWVTIDHYGAKASGDSFDNGPAITRAIQQSGYAIIPSVGNGTQVYGVDTTIEINADEQTLIGVDQNSRLKDNTPTNTPLIARENWASGDAEAYDKIVLRDFVIDSLDQTTRSAWTIDLSNGEQQKLINIRILSPTGDADTNKFGAWLGLSETATGDISGNTWLNEVKDCYFTKSTLVLNSSDNIISDCTFYGYDRDFALQVGGGCIIDGVEVGPGTTAGLQLKNELGNTIYAVKVTNFQSDGSNSETTGPAIYAAASQEIISCTFTGFHAWNANSKTIDLGDAHGCEIKGLIRQGDAGNNGAVDLDVTGTGNVIKTVHYRTSVAPKKSGGSGARTVFGNAASITNSDTSVFHPVPEVTVIEDTAQACFASIDTDFMSVPHQSDHFTFSRHFASFPDIDTGISNLTGSHGNCISIQFQGQTGSTANEGFAEFQTGADAANSIATNLAAFCGPLYFRADRGPVLFSAVVEPNLVTNVQYFIGYSDDNSTVEMPIYWNGASYVASATNAVGILYHATGSASVWRGIGVKAGVVTSQLDFPTTVTANAKMRLGFDLTTGGKARFIEDGVVIGTVANTVTATTDLCPWLGGYTPAGGASRKLRVYEFRARGRGTDA